MLSYPGGMRSNFLSEPSYTPILYVYTSEGYGELADLSEHSLLANAISIKILCAGQYGFP